MLKAKSIYIFDNLARHKSAANKDEKKRLIITGGSGLLGVELVRQAKECWDILYTWLSHPVEIPGVKGRLLDILDKNWVLSLFKDFRPHAIIHTAYSQENMPTITQGTANYVMDLVFTRTTVLLIGTRPKPGLTSNQIVTKTEQQCGKRLAGPPSLPVFSRNLFISGYD